ncbi:Protein ACY-3 [Aphelenchoides avenae]|nr:Protein ACY-3 [Aphelenchus avenae]
MRFADSEVEKGYHLVMDRWFIPALAISIFFLVVYGIYQVLVMPRLITTLALIIIALAVMFVVLLMLYVNYFESFCQFVTRTSAGHSIAILLIMVLLYTCGMVNTFSCPSLAVSRVCQAVHYSTISVVLWMLTTAVFVRFPSLYLLGALSLSICVYCVHLFVTHADLYIYYSEFTGWRVQVDILIGLFTLAFLIYLQARRNERMIRLDHLSLLKAMDERRKLERFEYINEQILLNALPTHVAYNYLMRTDPYCHLCHTVGVISAKFGNERDWQGEAGFNRLANLVYKLDRMAEGFKGVEKVRSAHCVYTAAVGVLPEVNVNINDVPHTIGDLLAALANFAVSMCKLADEEGIDLAVGIDCGAALSVVIGGDRPRYDVIGIPCIRSQKLVKATRRYKILVSEDVYLALRPRHFAFDDHHPMKLEQGLTAYGLVDVKNTVGCNQVTTTPLFYRHGDFAESRSMDDAGSDDVQLQDETTQSTTCHTTMDVSIDMDTKSRLTGLSPADTSPMRHHNPLEMFASMNSSFSSEMYSIDVSVDDAATDSDLEWITPEMLSRERAGLRTDAARAGRSAHPPSKHPASASVSYKGDRAKQYSDFSEYENPMQSRASLSSRMRRKRFRPSISRNGPKLPSWLSSRTSFNSEMSIPASVEGSSTALDRLNAAARRVDKMLHELASVDNYASPSLPEAPFPVNLGGPMCTSVHSVNSYQREMSSACQTEYDNADSDGACSDSEMIATSKLERLKRALKGSNTTKPPAGDNRRQKKWRYGELSGPSQRRLRHDNGNDADVDSICSSLASSVMFDRLRWKSVHSIGYENEYELVSEREDSTSVAGAEEPFVKRSVGAGINFPPMDADSDVEVAEARTQVEALSRDIRQNFGDYQLASFSDIDR